MCEPIFHVCELEQFGCLAARQKVSRCNTRGEFEDSLHAGDKACKARDPPLQNRGISGFTKRTPKKIHQKTYPE